LVGAKFVDAPTYIARYGVSRSKAFRDLAITRSPLFNDENAIMNFRVTEDELYPYIKMRLEKYGASLYTIAAELGITNETVRKYIARNKIFPVVYRKEFPICPKCGINTMSRRSKVCKECMLKNETHVDK
jgi:hypothetical protein